MRWWTKEAGRFWKQAGIALAALFLCASFGHVSIIPARWYPSDLLVLPAILFCIVVSVYARRSIDILTRFTFGLSQGIILLTIYSNFWGRELRLGDPYAVFLEWAILATGYAVTFGVVTQLFAMNLSGTRTISESPSCHVCGYCLKGLPSPRCPECGTPFGPSNPPIEVPEKR